MARCNVTILLEGLDRRKTLGKIQGALKNEPMVLRQMGALLVAQGRQAFRDQRLGETLWPARYGGRKPPINIAGVVADFLAGRPVPKSNRFESRPAGIDSGETLRNLTVDRVVRVRGNQLILEAPTPQARKMQSDNQADRTTTQRLTKAMKKRMAEWMKKSRHRAKRFKKASAPLRRDDAAAAKLGFLFRRDKLITRAARRPFLGITDAIALQLTRIAGRSLLPTGTPGRVS